MSVSDMTLLSDPSGDRSRGDRPPQRIVSLCPPITELLFDLGLKDRVVGVSKQCRFPEVRVKETVSVGSNKSPNIAQIQSLHPDLIILDSREVEPVVTSLLKEEFAVWDSTPYSVLSAIEEVKALGKLVDKMDNADWIATKITTRFAEFQDGFQKKTGSKRVAFLASYKPWAAFGANTLANDLLQCIGIENVWDFEKRIHPVDQKKLPGGSSTTILLAEGPYSFHKRHVPVVNRRFPDSQVLLVREDLLTWQGSRLMRSPAYLLEIYKQLVV
jgi:ABC-type Fe3+-hydroxamate transport system substrate-binding protein